MAIAGEAELLKPENFVYWVVVTASTVGYGDFSPTTSLGKWLVSLWVIPLGLSVFALIVAKVGFYLSELATKGRRGLRMLKNQNHIIIIGWNGARTIRLIDLLLAKTQDEPMRIVLCVMSEIENPLPGKIDFVKVDSFTHESSMKRANLSEASRIIIDTDLDDVTLTTALYCSKVSPQSHMTAYFKDESLGELLCMHCSTVECIPSVSVEMLANSTIDPGSSSLQKQLLDSTHGMTQYTLNYQGNETTVADLFERLKKEFSATLIGLRTNSSEQITINPELSAVVQPGDTLFYIAEKRLNPTYLT